MKARIIIVILLVLAAGGFLYWNKGMSKQAQTPTVSETKTAGNMKLVSTAFENNQNIPSKYTCEGANINPPLTISDVPTDAKSLALVVDDPDAPMGTWVHWIVANIDPKTSQIPEKSAPKDATEGKTSFGKPGYGGPCPPASTQRGEPSGTHHYYFKLYALDTALSVSSSSTKQDLETAMTGHILQKTELVGLYSKK